MARALAVALALFVAVGFVPALAATPSPGVKDVMGYLNGDGLQFIRGDVAAVENEQNTAFAGVTAATDLHPLWAWSPAFLSGAANASPLTSTTEWVAVLRAGSAIVGTVRASTAYGTVELGAYTADAKTGTAIANAGAARLVLEPAGQLYAVSETTVSPLNPKAVAEMPTATPLAQMPAVVAARTGSAPPPSPAPSAVVSSAPPSATSAPPTAASTAPPATPVDPAPSAGVFRLPWWVTTASILGLAALIAAFWQRRQRDEAQWHAVDKFAERDRDEFGPRTPKQK